MSIGHLGARISALVDGQLSPQAAERALSHVSRCGLCHLELRSERRAREVMSSAGHEVSAPLDLTSRLLSLAADVSASGGEVPPGDRPGRGARMAGGTATAHEPPREGEGPTPASGDRGAGRTPRARGRLRVVWAGVGVVGLAASGVLALFTMGACPLVHPDPQVRVTFDELDAASHASTPGGAPGASAKIAPVPGHVAADLGLPPDANLLHASVASPAPGTTQASVSTTAGAAVVWRQQGVLDPSDLAGVDRVTYLDVELRVISRQPFYAVWQSGEEVVTLITSLPQDQVAQIVRTLSRPAVHSDFAGRVVRGWHVLGSHVVSAAS